MTVPVVGPPGTLAAMSTPDAEPGYRAITGPTWRNEVAARFGLTISLYRPGLKADRLPCPILVQIADRDAIAPPKAAQDAAWRATGRAEVRTYPIGHFEVYVGEPFERSDSRPAAVPRPPPRACRRGAATAAPSFAEPRRRVLRGHAHAIALKATCGALFAAVTPG